ncbi:hypothetical protein CPCC7001_21 [Cyanobium sp. PCC 7001]|nr:hypothetical protein CPCC7001_21 [Cyanobium sp. PCC 7001]
MPARPHLRGAGPSGRMGGGWPSGWWAAASPPKPAAPVGLAAAAPPRVIFATRGAAASLGRPEPAPPLG